MCGIALETTTEKKHTERPEYFCTAFFFRRILEAATILSASFNLSRDSLSGRWCVRRSEFRNAGHRPPCASARPEKKKSAITRLHEVRTLEEAFHPNFSFTLFLGKFTVACSAQPLFPRTFSGIACSRAPVTSGGSLDLEIIIAKFRQTILQRHVKLASYVIIKVHVTVDSHGTKLRNKNETDKKFDSDLGL